MAEPILLSTKAVLRVPPAALWSFLADTERLNRAIGLPPVKFVPFPDPGKKGHYTAETRSMGLRLAYEEFPFEWVEGRYYYIIRRFPEGPLEEVAGGIRLAPVEGGTELEVFARVKPRNWLGVVVAKTMLKKKATRDVLEISRAFEASALDPARGAPALPPPGLVSEERLKERASRMPAFAAAPKLFRHLLTASDLEVVRMRPFEAADRWGEDRLETLRLFLHASRAGIVDLHWSLLCPMCRVAASDTLTLGQLKTEAHCQTCRIRFDADLARSVEVRFSVNPAVRRAREETFCIGGPANMPGIVAQLRLEPGEMRREELVVPPGPLRVRCYQAPGPVALEARPAAIRARLGAGGLRVEAEGEGKGPVRLEVANELSGEALVVVERETWKADAATAAVVTSLQDFKDLFPAEAVAPGEEVGIAELALLFTDLRSSTELYRKVGDARAFAFVQNHFRYLVEQVARHRGGVVKTMGDAIMASFATGRDAVEAGMEMQRGWEAFEREYGRFDGVALKVGIHQGPSIAINNKGRLDYFGQTVNMAARVQGWSEGGDVVVSEDVYRDGEVRGFLERARVAAEALRVPLKGLEGDFTLWRLRRK